MINGVEAEWTVEIQNLWNEYKSEDMTDDAVSLANYFTPRPYKDEYNRGDNKRGFTYTFKNNVGRILVRNN